MTCPLHAEKKDRVSAPRGLTKPGTLRNPQAPKAKRIAKPDPGSG